MRLVLQWNNNDLLRASPLKPASDAAIRSL